MLIFVVIAIIWCLKCCVGVFFLLFRHAKMSSHIFAYFTPSTWSSWRRCEKRKAWTEPDTDEKWFPVGCGRLWYADVWMMSLIRGEQRLLDTCSDLAKEEMWLMLKDCLSVTVLTPDMMSWTPSLSCKFGVLCVTSNGYVSCSYFCSAS